jgi:hypothetical protein
MVQVDDAALETAVLNDMEVPLIDLNGLDLAPRQLNLRGATYTFVRSYPLKGYAAVAPADIAPIIASGRSVLMAERGTRLYLYEA